MLQCQNIDGLADECYRIMEALHQESPHSKGPLGTGKRLVVRNQITADIVSVLSTQVATVVPDRYATIAKSKTVDDKPCLMYYVYEHNNKDWVLSDQVRDTLHLILTTLKLGWERACDEDHACLVYQRRATQQIVFKRSIKGLPYNTDYLIRSLSELAFGQGFHRVCDCDCTLTVDSELRCGDTLFLFVDEARLADVEAFFRFGLTGQPSPV